MKVEGAGTQKAQDASDKLSQDYMYLSEKFNSETKKMQDSWTGEGSKGPAAAVDPLKDANLE